MKFFAGGILKLFKKWNL